MIIIINRWHFWRACGIFEFEFEFSTQTTDTIHTLNELQRLELSVVFLCDCNRDESIRMRVDMYIRKIEKSAMVKTLNAIDRFVAIHYSFAVPRRE